MTQIKNVVLILVFSWQLQMLVLSCPYQVPACSCDEDYLVCTDLNEIPLLKTGSDVALVTRATFDGGNISSIPDNSLPPGLRSLQFTNHPLTDISVDAFNTSANTLDELRITNAKFRRLPDAIRKLRNLTTLAIEDTFIDHWNNDTIQQIATTLKLVALTNVGLTSWPGWFSFFHSLTDVDLSMNSVLSVADDAFNSSKNTLTSLTLDNCNLTQVPKALSALTHLNDLDLSNNNIADVNGKPGIEQLIKFPCARTLNSLFINGIGLTATPNVSGITSLQQIFLSNNHISELITVSFPPGLRVLYLNNNKLRYVPEAIAKLSKLYTLSLSFNEITEVSLDYLPQGLFTLYLRSNKITNITDTFSTKSSFLQRLYLDSNPLSTISPLAFRNVNDLRILSLHNTDLTDVPLALTSLDRLTNLRISSVNCSAPPPKELIDWYNGRSVITIVGNCTTGGTLAVYLRDAGQTRPTTTQITQQANTQQTQSTQQANTQQTQSTTPGGDASTLQDSLCCRLSCLLLLLTAYIFL